MSNIPGWTSREELEWLSSQAKRFNTIVEIGAWCGRSTVVLLESCKQFVVTVDNWDFNLMRPYGNAEQARKTFWENVRKHPRYQDLYVLGMDSKLAAMVIPGRYDMVFIDANHSYEAVLEDIQLWLPKTKHLICGHDYSDNWFGVKKAVAEVFGNDFSIYESIWYKEL